MPLQLKVGETYGQLKIKQLDVPKPKKGFGRAALCKCLRCGNKNAVMRARFIGVTTKTCGCTREKWHKTKDIKHYRRLYHVWHAMKKRCLNIKDKDYLNYGARGIKVCKRWNNFTNFYNDMIDTYQPGLSIERIDLDVGYCPKNCCWIPIAEQAKNRRSSLKYRRQTNYQWPYAKQ